MGNVLSLAVARPVPPRHDPVVIVADLRISAALDRHGEAIMILRGFGRILAVFVIWLMAAAAPALAQKTFLRDDLIGEGQRLEEQLKRQISAQQPGAAAALRDGNAALARGDARRAYQLGILAAVASPQSFDAWRLISRAAQTIEPRDYRERWELAERSTAAGYLAYTRATSRNDEALALATLAEAFAKREQWRNALTAYRISLDLRDNAELRQTYEKLREERGFRLTEYKIDSDMATPRACFVFTEALQRGRIDFQPYVSVSGGRADVAVTAEDKQLCVEGLRHGERYQMVIRRGVPSSIPGESLLKTAEYDIYVRDRQPSVRFTGRNYVLPKTGQDGIPVVTVNTPRLDMEVVRIGERNMINSIHSEDFLTQLGSSSAKKIADESGRRIWSGTMDVATDLNKDVTTTFPISQAAGEMAPGVYVLLARPSGQKVDADSDFDEGASVATQWFVVSDIGLTSFSGPDGVHVLARSLANAQPMPGVKLRLLARNNEVLGEVTTDRTGHAVFPAGLARGALGLAPGLVQATLADDHGFLDLKQSAFDLSDRGVKGRVAPAALDAFLYTERGVYRSGETVHVTTLLRDQKGAAVIGLPLTLIVKRPDGVEYRRQIVQDQGAGGRAFSLALLSGISTGTWKVQAFTDPRKDAVGEASFLVEDYVPEKLELDVKPARTALTAGEPAELNVNARFLYGAPGSDLELSGEVTLRLAAKTGIPGLEDYQVGLTDEAYEPTKSDIEEPGKTSARGTARLMVAVPEAETTRPVEAEIAIRASEPGGRAITRTVTLPVRPKGVVVGVKPLFRNDEIGEGETAKFHVVVADGGGRRISKPGVKWTLSKVRRNYQWFFQEGRWAYEAVKTTRQVADGVINVGQAEPAEIATKVEWGNYRLDVVMDGAETSITFLAGYESDKSADTPDTLDVTLDRQAFNAGDTMKLRIAPRFAGEATVAILGDKVHEIRTVRVGTEGASVDIPVKADWTGSGYAVVLAHRPLDTAARRMPGRAIGLAWFTVDKAAKSLAVEIDAPQVMRPRQEMAVAARLTGLAAGEEAFVTLAAVDVGILNLTRYQLPNPSDHFFGQRQLAHEIRDLYGLLIDGMQGTRGQIRSGGDAAGKGIEGDVPNQPPVAFYTGIIRVGPDGTAKASFPIPAFNGSVKVMAVAWTRNRTGQAERTVISRDPVVLTATLPRFMNIGDQSRFHISIDNVEGEAGDYVVEVDAKGPVVLPAAATRQSFRLAKGGKTSLTIPVAGAGVGNAAFDVTISGPGVSAAQALSLRVQPSLHTLARRTVRPIEPNGQITMSPDLFTDLVPGSGRAAISVSPLASLDVPGVLKALDRYPYGCTEQTVSRALPLLYVNRLSSMEQLGLDGSMEERVAAAVERVLARQGSNGSFGLWGIGGDDLWLDAFVGDFLTRTRESRLNVPAQGFNQAMDRLRNQVANTGEFKKEDGPAMAYALYVLARNGRPVMGDLRYLADNKIADMGSPMAQAQIGAALALLGDRGRARSAFAKAIEALQGQIRPNDAEPLLWRADYGSRLRDAVGVMALLAETNGDAADIARLVPLVEAARGNARQTSTQDNLWMVLAAQALANQANGLRLAVNGQERQGSFYRTVSQETLEVQPLVIGNQGQAVARAVITVSGVPLTPEPALAQGYTVQRQLFTMKGEPVDPAKLRQSERYVVAVKVTQQSNVLGRVMIVDPLPAGLEIENRNLTEGATLEGLPFLKQGGWIVEAVAPTHTESRDDRFVAAFESGTATHGSFGAAYIVRAVSPGRYVQPAAFAEDMYRPDRFGRTAFGIVEIAAR
jgi:alpha-2-macroglobulin